MEKALTSDQLKRPKAILRGLQWVSQQAENVSAVYNERGAFWEKWALIEHAILAAAQYKDSPASEVTLKEYPGNDQHAGQKADIHIRNAAGAILIKLSCEGLQKSLEYSVSEEINKVIEYKIEGFSSAWVIMITVSKEAKDRLNVWKDIWRAQHAATLTEKVEDEIVNEMEKALSNGQPSNLKEDFASGQLSQRLSDRIWKEMTSEEAIRHGQISIPSKDQEHMTLWYWYKYKRAQN